MGYHRLNVLKILYLLPFLCILDTSANTSKFLLTERINETTSQQPNDITRGSLVIGGTQRRRSEIQRTDHPNRIEESRGHNVGPTDSESDIDSHSADDV